jgi:hypothetical protein
MTAFSFRRVGALLLRHLYIMRGSWPRLLEMAYWPAVNMVVWGFTSQFFSSHSQWVAQAGGILIGAVLLWDVMFRGNLGVALSFMEEMWSRNLGHLSVSPLRPVELVAGLLAMSLIRTLIGVVPAMLLAVPLYHYSIFDLGLPLLAKFRAQYEPLEPAARREPAPAPAPRAPASSLAQISWTRFRWASHQRVSLVAPAPVRVREKNQSSKAMLRSPPYLVVSRNVAARVSALEYRCQAPAAAAEKSLTAAALARSAYIFTPDMAVSTMFSRSCLRSSMRTLRICTAS